MTPSLLPRSLAALVTAAAVALPIAGCGDTSGAGGGGNAGADPAAYLPASAPVYVEAQLRPQGDLKANVTAVAGKILRTGDPGGTVVGWIDAALAGDGATYAKDVAPWLGQRAGLAITAVGAGGHHVDVVGAVASQNDDAAQKFVDATKDGVSRQYRGISYRYRSADDLALAVVDHAVVVGTEKAFKSAIDATSGGALADAGTFKKARAVVGTDGLGFAYADPARLVDLVVGAAPATGISGGAASLQALKGMLAGSGLESVAASLNVAPDALRIDAAAVGLKAKAGSGDGAGAAAAVPAGSWLSVGVGDVGAMLRSAITSTGSGGGIGGLDPQMLLQGLQSQLGIDVQKDLLAWMGDAALFVRGTTKADLGGALVVKSKDPAASQASIGKLRTLLKMLNVHVGSLHGAPAGASGFSVTVGSSLPGTVDVAAKGDQFVVAYGKDALKDALSPASPLADTAPFKTAAGLLGGASPSLFLDTPQVVKLVASLAGGDTRFQKAKPTLEAFGPAAAGVSPDGDVTRLKAAISVP
jgi:hypothetical protein